MLKYHLSPALRTPFFDASCSPCWLLSLQKKRFLAEAMLNYNSNSTNLKCSRVVRVSETHLHGFSLWLHALGLVMCTVAQAEFSYRTILKNL